MRGRQASIYFSEDDWIHAAQYQVRWDRDGKFRLPLHRRRLRTRWAPSLRLVWAFARLKEASVDTTTTSHGRLVLGVLATIGEFERDLIRSRMNDGRKRALANGVKFGRKNKLTYFHGRRRWPASRQARPSR